jgi:hypothetical protein
LPPRLKKLLVRNSCTLPVQAIGLGVGEATISGFWLWPNMIAVALTASPIVVVIIGLGYILNSHQIVHNCYIGMTRVMVAMSLDRLLPEWVSKVDEKRHTPANAHWAYFLASIPVILLYNLYPGWVGLTLGVTFACGYVFVITCLAGACCPIAQRMYTNRRPVRRIRSATFRWSPSWARLVSSWRRDGVDVHVLSAAWADQRAGIYGCVRRIGILGGLVFHRQECAKIQGHQRGLCLQGDPARIKLLYYHFAGHGFA